MKITVIGLSKDAEFDLGIVLSLFSTNDIIMLNGLLKPIGIVFGIGFIIYCVSLYRRYKRKLDTRNFMEFTEESPHGTISQNMDVIDDQDESAYSDFSPRNP